MRDLPLVSALRGPRYSSCRTLLGGVILLALLPSPSLAQNADLRQLAIDWARGSYKSPLVCEMDGELIRGLRRVLLTPAPRHSAHPEGRVIFVEMETERASRCFTDLGENVANLKGRLTIRYPGPARPDSARRELKNKLKQEKGLEFEVVHGTVLETPVGETDAEAQPTDFAGGIVMLDRVRPGSDAERLLSDYKSPRKLQLTVRARDGRTVSLPIFLADFR